MLLIPDTLVQAQSKMETLDDYALIIDIFRKGNYKIFSIQLLNREFKAIRYSAVDESSETLESKTLSPEEAKNIEYIISETFLDSLNHEYINKGVKGEYHLVYHISKGEKQKEIYVYYEEQQDLRKLYKRLMMLVPEGFRIWYYG